MDIWLNAVRASQAAAPGGFVSTWNTANTSTGSSNSDQVSLPLVNGGTYNFTVSWGDGNEDTITAWDAAAKTHTYASVGTYTITVAGQCWGWLFNNGGDRLKILEISAWGEDWRPNNTSGVFWGCSNLDVVATDTPNLTGITDLSNFFRVCGSLVFNSSIGDWDIANINFIGGMFRDATLFDHNIGGWNVGNVTTAVNTFVGVTLSTANYDALLIGWEAQSPALQNDVGFHGGNSKYSAGAAATARSNLVTTHNWTITDGGPA
jgi:hypothetical protein